MVSEADEMQMNLSKLKNVVKKWQNKYRDNQAVFLTTVDIYYKICDLQSPEFYSLEKRLKGE